MTGYPGNPEILVLVSDSATERGIAKALELLGGNAVGVDSPADLSDPGTEGIRGVIASIDLVAQAPPAQIQALKRLSAKVPLLLFPTDGEAGVSRNSVRSLFALGAPELEVSRPAPVRTFEFSQDDVLWPFCGMEMIEDHYRLAAAVEARGPGVDPLISSRQGSTFFRWRQGPQEVFVSTTSPLEAVTAARFREEFCPGRFAGLMPLLVFARASLGDAGWHPPTARATFMIDDPNLRSMRYGFLDYRAIVKAAKDRDLHFTIAMIPIDYKKTGKHVADFINEHSRYISLVMHGVDHLKWEFDREVPIERAVASLEDGLRRMDAHRTTTGLGFPLAMTFPYDGCNPTWLEALRRAGFRATFGSLTPPLATEQGDDALHGMYPAEMAFQGFPVIKRFETNEPRERLLFQAWLGQPLTIYTHHEFFRGGMEPALDLTDFVDRQVDPTWGGVDFVLGENYQYRRLGGMREIRAFSNAIRVGADSGMPIRRVVKPGVANLTQELACVDGAEVSAVHRQGHGLIVDEIPGHGAELAISFQPRNQDGTAAQYRMPLRAAARRLATELRDRSSAFLARSAAVGRHKQT